MTRTYGIHFYMYDSVFKSVFGRDPKNSKEFREFGATCKKIINEETNWNQVYQLAKVELSRIK